MSTKPLAAPRLRLAERHQMKLDERSLDQLLPPDHSARTVWACVDGLDLSPLLERIKAVAGNPGQPTIDPRILLSLWLQATLDGIGSARQLDRLTGEHIAYEWLCGAVSVTELGNEESCSVWREVLRISYLPSHGQCRKMLSAVSPEPLSG